MAQSQLRVIPGPKNLIVIVDDQSTSRAILEQVVRGVDANVRVEAFESPIEAVSWNCVMPISLTPGGAVGWTSTGSFASSIACQIFA